MTGATRVTTTDELSGMKALAEGLDRELEVEDFGIYLTGPGVFDDVQLGRKPADAEATLVRMLERSLRGERSRSKSRSLVGSD